MHVVTKRMPNANAVIKVDTVHKKARLECTKKKIPHTEVLTAYGSGYSIPN